MKLAYSSNAYMKYPIRDAISRIARLGYAGIEIMADVPHAWPASTSEREIDEISRLLAENGLTISNINAFMMNAVGDFWHPSWIDPDPDVRRVRIRHTIDALSMARRLGATCITTEPGGPVPAGMSYESAMDIFVDGLNEALRHAETQGVKLLVEPEPELLIENVDQCLELAARIDSPMFGVNFDIGHFYCVNELLPEAVGRLQHLTRHYHFEDIAETRVHKHLIPGRGSIDFASVFQAIDRTGYDDWITVELYPHLDDPDSAGREALEYLTGVILP